MYSLICYVCQRRFQTLLSLPNHKQAHGLVPPLASRLTTDVCPICSQQLGTRKKTLLYLRNRSSASTHQWIKKLMPGLSTSSTPRTLPFSLTVMPAAGPIDKRDKP
eukprot:4127171-Amphidinium_carterae.1